MDNDLTQGNVMNYITKHTQLFAKSLTLSLGLTLAACGGGGGGTTYPSIQYTGTTSPATVTAANADEFPVAMLEGSTSSAEANPYGAALNSETTPDAQHTAMLNILAEQVKNNIIARNNNTDNNIASAATQSQSGTCPTHPGSMTVTDNSTQTSINASITYDNFCIGNFSTDNLEMSIHGRMRFGGSLISTDPLIIRSITMSIEYMKLTVRNISGTFSEEFSGSMTITFDETTNNNITNMSISTNFQANGLTYKVENLVVDTSSGLNISGRFYHPVHGYVDVTTTQNFTLISIDPDKYCGGKMELVGTDVSSVSTTIEFEADNSCSQYRVCVRPTSDASCIAGASFVDWP